MKNVRKSMHMTSLLVLGMTVLMLCVSSISAETLRIWTWGGYVTDEHKQIFTDLVKEKYGVDLTLEVTLVGENEEFFPALRDNKADIITPSHNVPRDERYQLIEHQLVLPLNLENIPNYKNVDPGLQYAEYSAEGDVLYGVPVATGPYGLFYNTAIVKEAPMSWSILWNPRYKNQYTFGKGQYEGNIYITALAMGMSRDDMSSYEKLNTPEFQGKLEQFVVNAHSMWEIAESAEDLKGLALGLGWGDAVSGLAEMGETWKQAEPEEGTIAWVDTFMIADALEDKPQLKQIAEEWLNYTLSDDYQMFILRDVGVLPIVTTIKEQLTPEEIARFHLDDPTHFQKYRIPWPTLKETNREGLIQLWDNALKMAQ
ncbi:MAG: extracellular solute-binding protein [bacterium]|nr:extracellular solute-binding protein [bacterium]